MFQRIGPAAYRADLHNIKTLCEWLGNPQERLRCIHVAGTNGKGSVTHLIASVLQEAGYKVGVYTSPHYKDYRERIKINGRFISPHYITKFVNQYRGKFATLNASFFEITTALCFQYFADKKVDYAVIETGMGGRLDSTNIIRPLLSVITNISFDHQQFLGDTLPQIASEKAGIIKPGIPVVIGEIHPQTREVFIRTASERGSPIVFAEQLCKGKLPKSDLAGDYQQKNIRTALAAVICLQNSGVEISAKAVKKGFANVTANTRIMGRWMVRRKNPLVIFDSAHNEAGIRAVVSQLKKIKYERLRWVYGAVADKDLTAIFRLLPRHATFYFCNARIPRALPAGELHRLACAHGLQGDYYRSVRSAFRQAMRDAGPRDVVLVAGSVFIVGELL